MTFGGIRNSRARNSSKVTLKVLKRQRECQLYLNEIPPPCYYLNPRDVGFLFRKQIVLNRIQSQRFAHARKAAPVNGRGAEFFQTAAMLGRGISLVSGEVISRKN